MPLLIEGNPNFVTRIVTNLHSFDLAFENRRGKTGIPLMSTIEIYGPTGCGKSTIAYSLAGMIGTQLHKNIAIADFERFDPEFLEDVLNFTGFDGTLNYISGDNDEAVMDSLIATIKDENYAIGIVDSVGAISPIAETSGSIGEANMGRRARIMAQFIRKATHLLKTKETAIFFAINHVHPIMGMAHGTTTPGGETLKYLYAARIKIKRKEDFPDGSYIIEGQIVKNSFGYVGKKFYLFILAGMGIHVGLTALWDCIMQDKVKYANGVIKHDGQSLGRLSKFVKTAKENIHDFDLFHELLRDKIQEQESESE